MNRSTIRRGLARSDVVFLTLLFAGYALWAACELPYMRYQVNADGVFYLSNARRILAGDLGGALNAFWPPLLSWIFVPFLALGLEPLLAAKVANLVLGGVLLLGIWMFAGRFTTRFPVRAAVCVAALPCALFWAVFAITPDLLLVDALIFYLHFAFAAESGPLSRRDAVLAGLWGGIAYLAKTYAFVFFLVHWTIDHALRASSRRGPRAATERRGLLASFGIGLAAFFAVAAPWMTAISVNHGGVTFGTSGKYQVGLVAAANGPVGTRNHPIHAQGLLAPENEGEICGWLDPPDTVFPPWPGLAESTTHVAHLVAKNSDDLQSILCGFSVLAPYLVFAALIAAAWAFRRGDDSSRIVGSRLARAVLAGATYASGFLPLLLEPRYLWLLAVLLLMLLAGLGELLAARMRGLSWLAGVLVLGAGSTLASNPFIWLPRLKYFGRVHAERAEELERQGVDLRGKRLASDDHWHATLYLDVYMRAQYFGTPRDLVDPMAVRRELDFHRIEAFILWLPPDAPVPDYLDGFHRTGQCSNGIPLSVFERAR